ncbi:MAG: SDR family oxidoreductase [Chlamydiae bacterium]|nr:SDR family oxidoreductase [Chlamydiota bacterium]
MFLSGFPVDDLFKVEGKTVLIVGASSGIGLHAAKMFAKRGARVVLSARRKNLLQALAKELNCEFFQMDVTKEDSIQAVLSQINRLDVVLNTSGTAIRKPILSQTVEDWDTLMDVNLKGVWNVSRLAINHMQDRGIEGKIINLSSVLAYVTAPNYVLYATSKAGVEHMTRSLALESAKYRININCIAPGYIETDLNREYLQKVIGKDVIEATPMGRLGNLEDLDGVLLLLASDASKFITGSTIRVNGGICVNKLF